MQWNYLIIAGVSMCGAAMYSFASVESDAVKARTQAMSEISDNMRLLGSMLKGQTDFDLDIAKLAIQNIANLAAKAPVLFEVEAIDPHAEAKPEIWSNYDDFVDKALHALNPAIPIFVIGLSAPPAIITSASPFIMSLAASPIECAPVEQAVETA